MLPSPCFPTCCFCCLQIRFCWPNPLNHPTSHRHIPLDATPTLDHTHSPTPLTSSPHTHTLAHISSHSHGFLQESSSSNQCGSQTRSRSETASSEQADPTRTKCTRPSVMSIDSSASCSLLDCLYVCLCIAPSVVVAVAAADAAKKTYVDLKAEPTQVRCTACPHEIEVPPTAFQWTCAVRQRGERKENTEGWRCAKSGRGRNSGGLDPPDLRRSGSASPPHLTHSFALFIVCSCLSGWPREQALR